MVVQKDSLITKCISVPRWQTFKNYVNISNGYTSSVEHPLAESPLIRNARGPKTETQNFSRT